MDHTERHLGRHAEAEDQEHYRIQRHFWNGVKRAEDRFRHLSREAAYSKHQAERNAPHCRDRQRHGEGRHGRADMVPERRSGKSSPAKAKVRQGEVRATSPA